MNLVKNIESSDRIGFSIRGIRNPASTQTTDSIEIRIVNGADLSSVNQKLKGLFLTTVNPHLVQKATVRPGSLEPGVSTQYIFEFWPEHTISSGGGFMIIVPSQIQRDNDVTLQVEVEIEGRDTDQAVVFPRFVESARQLIVEQVVQGVQALEPGSKITLKIQGFDTPRTAEETDSFEITSFNQKDKKYMYFIDGAKSGLFIKSDCSYPCRTC